MERDIMDRDIMDQDWLNANLRMTQAAASQLAMRSDEEISLFLETLAERTLEAEAQILAANRKDLARMDTADPKYDRLLLDHDRLAAIADDLRNVAALTSPVGEVLEQRTLENGLQLSKVRVGSISPARILRNVDLPAPLGPIRP